MRIGIDCRLSGKKHAGIGRYITNLVSRIVKLDKHNQYVLFFYDQNQADELAISGKNIKKVIVKIPHYSLLEQIKLPFILSKYNLNLLHVPHFNAPIFYFGKTIITIHDLLWHERKGGDVTTLSSWKYYLKYIGYRFVSSFVIKKASKILVPSKVIKKTLSSYYPQVKEKIVVTLEGIDQNLVDKDSIKIKKINQNQLLYVGSLYPHKNIDLVLRSLKDLPEIKLAIVGSRNVFVDKIKKRVKDLNLENRVEFLGFVDDKTLKKLYKQSLALVQPSLSEGFGLTGIEAMAAGGLVLSSNIPVFQEIYQDSAVLFDPNDEKAFISAVNQVKKINRTNQVKKNLEFVKRFNWQEMAQQTLDQYQSVLNK